MIENRNLTPEEKKLFNKELLSYLSKVSIDDSKKNIIEFYVNGEVVIKVIRNGNNWEFFNANREKIRNITTSHKNCVIKFALMTGLPDYYEHKKNSFKLMKNTGLFR